MLSRKASILLNIREIKLSGRELSSEIYNRENFVQIIGHFTRETLNTKIKPYISNL